MRFAIRLILFVVCAQLATAWSPAGAVTSGEALQQGGQQSTPEAEHDPAHPPIDVEPEMIRHIHHKAMSAGVANVEAVLTSFDDPQVFPDSDLVFECDVLHHVRNRAPWLQRIYDALRPGARLVLIEFREGKLPQGPPESVKISKQEMVALVQQVGFHLKEDRDQLLPYQNFLVFVKP